MAVSPEPHGALQGRPLRLLANVARRPSRRPSPTSRSSEALDLGPNGEDNGHEDEQGDPDPRQQPTPTVEKVQETHGC